MQDKPKKIEVEIKANHWNVLKSRRIDLNKFIADCIEVFLISDLNTPKDPPGKE